VVHQATAGFWREFGNLPPAIRGRAEKQFALLKVDPHHPSLQFKRVGVRHGEEIWSARVTLSYRPLAIRRAEGYLWFWIGNHTSYDSLIS
jgi:hypothetical protein